MTGEKDLLIRAYAAYNARDVQGLLSVVSHDVDWPAGPGRDQRLHGRDAVGAHWRQQWARTRTHDSPHSFTRLDDGRVVADIDQVVRALDGLLLAQGAFRHVHRIQDSLITRMDIETVTQHRETPSRPRRRDRAAARPGGR